MAYGRFTASIRSAIKQWQTVEKYATDPWLSVDHWLRNVGLESIRKSEDLCNPLKHSHKAQHRQCYAKYKEVLVRDEYLHNCYTTHTTSLQENLLAKQAADWEEFGLKGRVLYSNVVHGWSKLRLILINPEYTAKKLQ
jgi:hypothetical protein